MRFQNCFLVLSLFVLLFAIILVPISYAEVRGEQEYWINCMTQIVNKESSWGFTEITAASMGQYLGYFGSEYIHFKYAKNEISIIGKRNDGIVDYRSWENLSDASLREVLSKLINLLDTESNKYLQDVSINVDIIDSPFELYMVYMDGRWYGAYNDTIIRQIDPLLFLDNLFHNSDVVFRRVVGT